MNIHIANDTVFLNGVRDLFDHYYPGENKYYIISSNLLKARLSKVSKRNNTKVFSILSPLAIRRIKKEVQPGDQVFVHFLSTFNAPIALDISKQKQVKLYWIFYGSDLYNMLVEKGVYKLEDIEVSRQNPVRIVVRFFKDVLLSSYFRTNIRTIRERFLAKLDYFCFWNHFDYELLKKHYSTNAEFKYFRYFLNTDVEDSDNLTQKKQGVIMLNHSASLSGNHIKLLEQIAQLDENHKISKLLVPLSYGPVSNRDRVIDFGNRALKYCFNPITEMLPIDSYYNMLEEVSAAIFGHRRQEGAGNIFRLIARGTKVFLREDNTLLKYLKERDVEVFSIEKDLKSIEDLQALSLDQQEKNRKIVLEEYSEEAREKVYRELFD